MAVKVEIGVIGKLSFEIGFGAFHTHERNGGAQCDTIAFFGGELSEEAYMVAFKSFDAVDNLGRGGAFGEIFGCD